MKTISILIPCFNEQENVIAISRAIEEEIQKNLPQYDYEIIFIDNDSQDNTRPLIRELCKQNPKIKAIFNARNFGQFNSPYYGILQTIGDCTIPICADFQDPVEMIPKFVHEWENGAKIVAAVKSESDENKLVRFLRTCYYKLIKKISPVEQIEHFTGFGLYDRTFVEVLRNLKDPTPFMRGIVAELGYKKVILKYRQAKRRAGKTHNNWYSLFDAAMLSFTSYTKAGLRIATFFGIIVSTICFLIVLFYLGYKIIYWDNFNAGMTPLIIGVFLLGGLQLFFIGFIGEYIMSINDRIKNRPLVIEEERINF
ncbi:MAG: glycosyltransferase family 2 protein [Bacteroidales bacterium]|nr:glycosyltransferase family 2 protein [Bacteroidales bacterium]MBR6277608.1 glycosyltransferase family 2 protein [Bacteroidales bacterium]